ncbi:DUF6086 family protein [Streptomyces sp. NPDC059477]|uniref:DUF6086 family protein n=1 Tax=Streptomyces sp. NPDC059477 TaxID=3346847 RepID=UPI00368E28EF
MSQDFVLGRETLWNPSSGAAELFVRHVRLWEAPLGVASGVGPVKCDEYRIDPAAFETYLNALVLARRARVEVGRPGRARVEVRRPERTEYREVQVPSPGGAGWWEELRAAAGVPARSMPVRGRGVRRPDGPAVRVRRAWRGPRGRFPWTSWALPLVTLGASPGRQRPNCSIRCSRHRSISFPISPWRYSKKASVSAIR